MNEVYIVTWVNEFDGDMEMYVAETREIANDFHCQLAMDNVASNISVRPVQSESIHLPEPVVANYFGDLPEPVVANYSGEMAS